MNQKNKPKKLRVYSQKFKRADWADSVKPEKYKHYKLLKELAADLNIDPRTIRRLEKEGIFPEPVRITRGKITMRLYSPENEAEILEIWKEGHWRKVDRWKRERESTYR